MSTPRVGVLSFQGSFQPHLDVLSRLGVDHTGVKSAADLISCTHLIIPGGESTVMSQFLRETGLDDVIRTRYGTRSLALFGTCAGAILIGREPALPAGAPLPPGRQPSRLDLAPVAVARNAYGRQRESSVRTVTGLGPLAGLSVEGVFIRAPKMEALPSGAALELGREGDDSVLLLCDRALLCAFHPELAADDRIHRYFIESV